MLRNLIQIILDIIVGMPASLNLLGAGPPQESALPEPQSSVGDHVREEKQVPTEASPEDSHLQEGTSIHTEDALTQSSCGVSESQSYDTNSFESCNTEDPENNQVLVNGTGESDFVSNTANNETQIKATDFTLNSAPCESVSIPESNNGNRKDSEYESAEEVDLPPRDNSSATLKTDNLTELTDTALNNASKNGLIQNETIETILSNGEVEDLENLEIKREKKTEEVNQNISVTESICFINENGISESEARNLNFDNKNNYTSIESRAKILSQDTLLELNSFEENENYINNECESKSENNSDSDIIHIEKLNKENSEVSQQIDINDELSNDTSIEASKDESSAEVVNANFHSDEAQQRLPPLGEETPLPRPPTVDEAYLPSPTGDDTSTLKTEEEKYLKSPYEDETPLPPPSVDDIPLRKLSIDDIPLRKLSIDDIPLPVPSVKETPLPSLSVENTPLTPPPTPSNVEDISLQTSSEVKEELPPPPELIDPDDIPIPKSKGYNLDFLDDIEDPNFNPFQTKTGVRTSPPPSPTDGPKLPPLKPAVKKKKVPGKVDSPTVAVTNAKGVPDTANPVNEKSKVSEKEALNNIKNNNNNNKNNFNDNESLNVVVNESIKIEDDNQVLEKKIDDSPKKKPPRKLGQKPKSSPVKNTSQKKPVVETNNNIIEEKENEEQIIVPKKGYNLDFLDNLDDPNFNPFETKTAVVNNFEANAKSAKENPVENGVNNSNIDKTKLDTEDKSKPKTVTPKRTPIKKKVSGIKKQTKTKIENKDSSIENLSETTSNEEIREPPKTGYNLDFLDNLDDPNFNPFETKTAIKNLEPIATSTPSKDTTDNSSVSNKKTEIKTIKKKIEEESIENLDQEEIVTDICTEKSKQDDITESNSIPEDNSIVESINNIEKTNPTSTNTEEARPTKVEPSVDSVVTVVPSVSRVERLDSSDEFSQLLVDEASRLAEELMNCSTDSGLPESRDSDDNNSTPVTIRGKHNTMADNTQACDENVNPFQRRSKVNRSPVLGKRMSGIGSEAVEDDPFKSHQHSFKRDAPTNDRTESPSLDDDSGIALGSRGDLENYVNHSEAGPDIATGLTSSDLKCASQSDCDDGEFLDDTITDEEFQQSEAFFKEATEMDNALRKNLVSPMGSQSKLSGDEVTPGTRGDDYKEEPQQSASPNTQQHKGSNISCTSDPSGDVLSPPREERSAPEGTSSPTPHASDRSEDKPSTSQKQALPDGYLSNTQVQELLKQQELQFEQKLLIAEVKASENEKALREQMRSDQRNSSSFNDSMAEVSQSRDALLKMVGQYKDMLAQLVSEKEKERQEQDEKIKQLEMERGQAMDDLANVENAFSDVHRKYERTKQVVDALRRNEETLRGAVEDYEAKIQRQEEKFLEFQRHAEEKIQQANEEYEGLRRSNDQEMTKMAALLKKAEMKIVSLQDALDRKSRENQELTQLCDDLISKVGSGS